MIYFILALVILVPTALTVITYKSYTARLSGMSGKKILLRNALSFAVLAAVVISCSVMAFASDAGTADSTAPEQSATSAVTEDGQASTDTPAADTSSYKGLGLLAAGLVTGLAGIGGGIAVAAGAPAAIAATSEDPKAFGKSLIFVALGESIALYGVVISILILNKI